jgi:hypothetical protein
MVKRFTSKDLPTGSDTGPASRSSAMREIISRSPGFLGRWSLLIFFIILLAVTGMMWFIKSPETLHARGMVYASGEGDVPGYARPGRKDTSGKTVKYEVLLVVGLKTAMGINAGQDVQVSLDAFPAREFGTLTGKVNEITPSPGEKRAVIKVILPGRLVTDFKKEIAYYHGMQASATIITGNSRLLTKIYQSITARRMVNELK